MYEILEREEVAPNIIFMRFKALKIAQSAKPGQFVIIRVDEKGERIPMGLSGWDQKDGTIDILFYILGTSTSKLAILKPGDAVMNIAGPLGTPTEIDQFGTVICVCGCFGIGPTLPIIKALKEKGNRVVTVVEGRSPDFIFWQDKLAEFSDEIHVLTGCDKQGWANDFIRNFLESGHKIDRIFIHGCPFMMKVCSEASKPANVKTIVSLTPIMVDGTGMCGACRVEVGGKTRFACVDGPDFDGHQVNWDGLVLRLRQFLPEENKSINLWERENWHRFIETPSSTIRTYKLEKIAEEDHSGACLSA